MLEAETGRSADSVNGTKSSVNFSEIFDDTTGNSISLNRRNTDSEKIMQLFGTVSISDSQQGSEVDPRYPDQVAFDVAQHTIQEIKDAAKLDGASRDAALQAISREIRGLSTLPEQYFDFDQFYVGVEKQLTLNGDKVALTSLAELDPGHVIRDVLDEEYLEKHGSSNADIIHNSVDNIVNQVVALSQVPMCLTDSALAPIFEAANTEMSTLTRAEQEVFAFNLAYELQSRPELKALLDGPSSTYGSFLYFGIFDVKPTDYQPPTPPTQDFGYDTAMNDLLEKLEKRDEPSPPEPPSPPSTP